MKPPGKTPQTIVEMVRHVLAVQVSFPIPDVAGALMTNVARQWQCSRYPLIYYYININKIMYRCQSRNFNAVPVAPPVH
jgi:hypothetical protein